MNIKLDPDGRFVLRPVPPGYELVVDGGQRSYCRTMLDALRYMSEEMIADIEDDSPVVSALAGVENAISEAAEMANLPSLTRVVVEIYELVRDGEKKGAVKKASLLLSGCETVPELKAHPDCKRFLNKAKILVKSMEMFARERGKKEGS